MLLEDENGTFLEIVTPEHSRDPTPALSVDTSTGCKSGSQQHKISSELETVDEQLQQEQQELQVQLEMARNEICVLTSKLEQQKLSIQLLALNDARERINQQMTENDELKHQLASSESENLKKEVQQSKERIKQLWTRNCAQAHEFDHILWEKDQEIDGLRKICTAINFTVQPSVTQQSVELDVAEALPTCTTLSSFLPIVCGTLQR